MAVPDSRRRAHPPAPDRVALPRGAPGRARDDELQGAQPKARRLRQRGAESHPRLQAGRQPGEGPGNDGGKLWRYDNWIRDVWNPTVRRIGIDATPKEFRASWETHLIAAGANTDDVAAIAGHSINVQAEHYRQALHRSSEFIKAAIG